MAQNKNSENYVRCKTIIVGNSEVGKTSIIQRYLRKFNPNEKSTVGASFTNKEEIINNDEDHSKNDQIRYFTLTFLLNILYNDIIDL